jgi:hypothetical protein
MQAGVLKRRWPIPLRQAMFRALVVARTAGEPHVNACRVAVALLHSGALDDFCGERQTSRNALIKALETGSELSFEIVESRAEASLAKEHVEYGSPAHLARVSPLTMHPNAQRAIDVVSRGEYGAEPVTAVELFRELLNADPDLAARLSAATKS